MKPLTIAAIVSLCSSAAQAETFHLFSKDHWSVSYVTEGDTEACVASVEGDGIYFSLDVTADGLTAWYIDPDNNFGEVQQEGYLAVWIDRKVKWETPALAQRATIQMLGISPEFLHELVDGQRLYIDQEFDGQWDAWFSLNGSAAAVVALADCSKKLGGMAS